jgi:hypothetical protein
MTAFGKSYWHSTRPVYVLFPCIKRRDADI